MRLTEFQTVRIKALLREDSAYDPFGNNDRAPRVGDTGTVVDIPRRSGGRLYYTVEGGRPDGTCAWLADFAEEELEAVVEEELEALVAPELEAVETNAAGAGTGITPERLSTRPISGATAELNAPFDRWLFAGTVAAVLLFAALMVSAAAGLFLVWPPEAAAGAGFRAAIVGVVFVAVGSLWAGEGTGEALITATIVGVVFFVLGTAGWYAWTAV